MTHTEGSRHNNTIICKRSQDAYRGESTEEVFKTSTGCSGLRKHRNLGVSGVEGGGGVIAEWRSNEGDGGNK